MYESLSNSQKLVMDAIEDGENVFVTGPAGTGKSYLLNYIKQQYLGKDLHVTASTGIAAVNVAGVTLHSWAGIGLGDMPLNLLLRRIFSVQGSKLRRKLKQTKILAIDEVSMISAYVLDLLNALLKAVRENPAPFGGLQIILFGDFFQLPPIIKKQDLLINDKHFCFESHSWKEAALKTFVLKETFRQKDEIFINLLNNIRHGIVTKENVELLRSRYQVEDEDEVLKPTILTTHNNFAENVNQKYLKNLPAMERRFFGKYEGDKKKIEFLKKNCLAQDELVLKIGAQVMMLKNTYAKEGVINGSLGIIRSFSSKKFYPIVEFANGSTITITPEEWCVQKYDETKKEMKVEAMMVQIPLLLSWAITVHKSQGMTLDKIECDLIDAFAEGQIYVALSRVKTLEGLFIKSFSVNKIKANPKILEFYSAL